MEQSGSNWPVDHPPTAQGPAAHGLRAPSSLSNLSHCRRKYSQLVAIFRDRSARDADPAFEQEIADLAVGERAALRLFFANQFAHDVFHAQRGRKEIAERNDLSRWKHHIFFRGGAADRRFVYADLLGDDGTRQWSKLANAIAEKILLQFADAFANSQ